MTSENITRNVGFEDTHINVDRGLTFTADVNATTKAEDKVESTGNSRAKAGTEAQVAVLDSTISVGEAAKLTATETGKVIASAETTSGDARAEAENEGPTGGFIDSRHRYGLSADGPEHHEPKADITIGTSGVIAATVANEATADASAVGGRSSASADAGQVAGFRNVGIAAGEGTSLTASVTGSMEANAASVGLPSDPDSGNASADAGSHDSSLVGIEAEHRFGGTAISFGRGAAIDAGASGTMASDAKTVTGKADADTRADLVAGIALGRDWHGHDMAPEAVASEPSAVASTAGPSPDSGDHSKHQAGLRLSIGESGSLIATGELTADAKAETVTGPAHAQVDIDTIGGIVDRGLLDPHRREPDAPQAEAVTTADAPLSQPDHPRDDHSRGTVLTIGKNGTVQAMAVGTSTADAAAVTAPGHESENKDHHGDSSHGDVVAEINHDHVVGIAIDKLAIGQNGTLYSGAQSTQTATAKVVSTGVDPTARVAEGDRVIGILDTEISTGGNLNVKAGTASDVEAYLTGKATASAVSSTDLTRAEAGEDSHVVGIQDGKLAVGENIGSGNGTFKVVADSELTATASAITGRVEAKAGSHDSEVVGLQSLPITIGKSGSIRTSAVGTVVSDASTITGDAEARSSQSARGLEDTKVRIGENGSVTASADLVGRATSDTTTGDSEAKVKLNAEGIDQRTRLISIGLEGNVSGKAIADGDATATAVTGKVEADSSIDAHGIHLERLGVVSIGEKGNVSGSADGGNALVTAANTNGPADAKGDYALAGILGERGAKITAGPLGGDISGSAIGRGDLLASTTTGRADATTHADLLGIAHTDLSAGLTGANKLTASADGRYITTSTTVSGDSDADGHVSVGALIGNAWGPPHTATLSGDVEAVAKLVNTVTATAVHGSASAIASGDAVGISGYAINILGSGTITAKVGSDTTTSASTVTV